jgi:hypothetical protein
MWWHCPCSCTVLTDWRLYQQEVLCLIACTVDVVYARCSCRFCWSAGQKSVALAHSVPQHVCRCTPLIASVNARQFTLCARCVAPHPIMTMLGVMLMQMQKCPFSTFPQFMLPQGMLPPKYLPPK